MLDLESFIRTLEPNDVLEAHITPRYLRALCPETTKCYEEDELRSHLRCVMNMGGKYTADLISFEKELMELEDEFEFPNLGAMVEHNKDILMDAMEKLSKLDSFVIDTDNIDLLLEDDDD